MIHNKTENFIFVKPRKMASTTVEIALSSYSDPTTILTPLSDEDEKIRYDKTGFRAQNYKYSINRNWLNQFNTLSRRLIRSQRFQFFYNHMTLAEVRVALGKSVFDAANKITIYRQPHDYIISYYYHNKQRGGDFNIWYWKNRHALFHITNYYYLDSRLCVDYIIDFSSISQSMDELFDHGIISKNKYKDFKLLKTKADRRPLESRDIETFFNGFDDIYDDIETNLKLPQKGKLQC